MHPQKINENLPIILHLLRLLSEDLALDLKTNIINFYFFCFSSYNI